MSDQADRIDPTEDDALDIGQWVWDVATSRVSRQFTTVLIDGKPYRLTVERLS